MIKVQKLVWGCTDTSVKHGLGCMQSLLEGGCGCLQLTLQQPVAALKLPDQPVSLHHTTSDEMISLDTLIHIVAVRVDHTQTWSTRGLEQI